MDLKSVKLSLYKYQIKSLKLSIGKKVKHDVEDTCILGFSIVEDYDKFYFPYFEMTVTVPNPIQREMTKNSNSIKANLTLYKGKFKEHFSNSDVSGTFRKTLANSFFVYMDNNTPDLTEDEQKIVEKSGEQYGQLSVVKLLLYNYSFYKKYDLIVNDNLLNASATDAIAYILNKVKMKKILMSPPVSHKKHKQFIITPISLADQLQRICKKYAVHKKGTIIFFGLDRGYIIEKTPKCTAYAQNEYKTTYIVADTVSKSSKSIGGSADNKEKKINIINAVDFEKHNQKELAKKELGSNVVRVSTDGKVTKTNKKSTKVTNVIAESEYKDSAKSIKNSINEMKNIVYVTFKDEDISMLTPNKQFVVTVTGAKYKKYNGKYRLSKVTHVFEKDGNYFQVASSAELKK